MDSQNDREFADCIEAVANFRKTDRSIGVDVTPMFQPMVDRLSLAGFRSYFLSRRYPGWRGESINGKYELANISEQELKSFDRAFLYLDFLRIVFSYVDDWETPTGFHVLLVNDQL